jgi:peptidoglycan/xylan/chitin deacetylase (PgdA/CDA1 family)
MSSFGKNVLLSPLRLTNIRWLQRLSPLPLLCPYHHLVSDEPVPYIDPLYAYKNSRQFETDLDYLLRHFRPVSLTDLVQQLSSSPNAGPPPGSFLLCFDDGLRQAYDIALPILLRKGVPAALFVNPAFVGNKTIFHDFRKGWLLHKLSLAPISAAVTKEACHLLGCNAPSTGRLRNAISCIDYSTRSVLDPLGSLLEVDWHEFARKHRPAMTLPELETWIAKGMSVGAHSMDHPLYSRLPLREQLTQTLDSMDWVSGNLDIPYRTFAFPHVDTGIGGAFFQQLFDAARPPHLVLGNSTGMREARPRVLHRYIGEDPARSAATMTKAVLAYSSFLNFIGSPYAGRS